MNRIKSPALFAGLILLLGCPSRSQDPTPLRLQPHGSAIVVSRIDTAVNWYRSLLSLKITNRMIDPQGQYKIVFLSSDLLFLEILELKGSLVPKELLAGKAAGTQMQGHFKIFFKTDDINRLLKHLSFLSIPVPQVWTDDKTGKKNFIIYDPDGNMVQFFD